MKFFFRNPQIDRLGAILRSTALNEKRRKAFETLQQEHLAVL